MNERAASLHELRRKVSARDKALIGSKAYQEAVKLVREKYGTDESTAAAFVQWQKTIASGGDANTKSNPTEKWHMKFDEETGLWRKIVQPGDIRPGGEEVPKT
jgi:hypothetical protein